MSNEGSITRFLRRAYPLTPHGSLLIALKDPAKGAIVSLATLGTGLAHRSASIRLARSTYHQAPERLSLTWLMNLLADSIPPLPRG